MITTYHNISFGTQTVPEQIPVVQGDTGREIVFILTDFTIPEGATATYYVQKPSGEAVYNTATISENNIIVALTAQSIIEVGENDMQVRVILDEDIVTSFRAILMVRPFLGIGAVESSTEINIFDQAVEDAYERITEEVVWPANFYGTCQTAAATQDKTVTVQGGFILKSGVVVNVMCAFTNSASQITLNVNNTGAKAVYYRGSKVSGDMLVANGMYTFVYANSHWNLAGLNGKLLQLDDTLTVSGKAADSKATGDAVNDLKADLTDLLNSAYVTDAASGAIATFPDGADNVPVKALTVEIEPVQSGSGDPSPSNVRPITGWSQAKVTRTGKNLLKYNNGMAGGTSNDITYTYNSDKTWVVNGTSTGVSMWLLWTGVTKSELPVGRYTYSRGVISSNVQLYIDKFNGGTRVGQITHMLNVENDTFDIDWSDYDTLNFGFWINTGVTVSNLSVKPMLRLASVSDATYEPYQGQTYTIDLSGTRYGGTFDAATGVLTVTHGYVDLGTLNYNFRNDNGTRQAWETYISEIKTVDGETTPNWLCSAFKVSKYNASWVPGLIAPGNPNSTTFVVCVNSGQYDSTNPSAFKAAMSGVQFVYELATPQTVQLTAEEVTTLLGQNNIFCDTGNVAVTYRCDTKKYIDKLLNA